LVLASPPKRSFLTMKIAETLNVQRKAAITRRHRQHAGRVRYPELVRNAE
jgi:hypothetical protein